MVQKRKRMKKIILTWLLFAGFAISMCAQQSTAEKFKASYKNSNPDNTVLVDAYLYDPDTTGTNIRDMPGGKVIRVVYPHRQYNMVGLIESHNGWFRIWPEIETVDGEPIILKTNDCWIHGSLIHVSTSNYGGQTIKFYAKPNAKSNVVFTVNEEISLSFIAVAPNWVKVKYVSPDGKIHIGWTDTEWLCANPVSSCS